MSKKTNSVPSPYHKDFKRYINKNVTKKKCVLCGFDRAVDRCHIIPRHLLRRVKGYRQYAKYGETSKNIVYLCKNHHFLYDHFALNEGEWRLMLSYVHDRMWPEIMEIVNSDLETEGKYDHAFEVRERKFERWKQSFAKAAVAHGFLFKLNYGERK